MKFLTPGGVVEVDLAASAMVAEAIERLRQHPAAAGRCVAHLVHDQRILQADKTLAESGVDPGATVVAVFRPRCKRQAAGPPQRVTREALRQTVGDARAALGHEVADDEPEREDVMLVPSPLQAILRERGMMGSSLGALLQQLEVLVQREPPDDEEVPPEAERERELDRLIPINAELRKQLVEDFGFPESRAKKALWLNKFDVNRAVDWLVGTAEDVQDQPITAREFRAIKRHFGVASSSAAAAGASPDSRAMSPPSPADPGSGAPSAAPEEADDPMPLRPGDEDQPADADPSPPAGADPHLLQFLMDVGFAEADCIEALLQANNVPEAALTILVARSGMALDSPSVREALAAVLAGGEEGVDYRIGSDDGDQDMEE